MLLPDRRATQVGGAGSASTEPTSGGIGVFCICVVHVNLLIGMQILCDADVVALSKRLKGSA